MVDHERLDRAVEARRLDLGLSWVQLAAKAGVSDVSLRNFRKGRGSPRALNKRRLEQALQWAPGSWDAVLAGGDPLEAGARGDHSLLELRSELEDSLAELESIGAKRTSAYKMLTERLEQLDARLLEAAASPKLDETGT